MSLLLLSQGDIALLFFKANVSQLPYKQLKKKKCLIQKNFLFLVEEEAGSIAFQHTSVPPQELGERHGTTETGVIS